MILIFIMPKLTFIKTQIKIGRSHHVKLLPRTDATVSSMIAYAEENLLITRAQTININVE